MRKMNITCDNEECNALIFSVKEAIVVSETKINTAGKTIRVTKDYCSEKCLAKDRGYEVK